MPPCWLLNKLGHVALGHREHRCSARRRDIDRFVKPRPSRLSWEDFLFTERGGFHILRSAWRAASRFRVRRCAHQPLPRVGGSGHQWWRRQRCLIERQRRGQRLVGLSDRQLFHQLHLQIAFATHGPQPNHQKHAAHARPAPNDPSVAKFRISLTPSTRPQFLGAPFPTVPSRPSWSAGCSRAKKAWPISAKAPAYRESRYARSKDRSRLRPQDYWVRGSTAFSSPFSFASQKNFGL